jgi:predicted nucleic acid-binding protein
VNNFMNAVDTNVLLYSVDRNEPAKQLKAQQLLSELHGSPKPTLLLWQVLGETGQQLRRWRDQGRLTATEFSQHIRAFRHLFPLSLPTVETFDFALSLADRFSLSLGQHDSRSLPGRWRRPLLHRRHRRATYDRRDRVDQSLRLIAHVPTKPGIGVQLDWDLIDRTCVEHKMTNG